MTNERRKKQPPNVYDAECVFIGFTISISLYANQTKSQFFNWSYKNENDNGYGQKYFLVFFVSGLKCNGKEYRGKERIC